VKYATSPDTLPPGEHFVILVFRTLNIPYDKDDYTTEKVVDYIVYTDKVEWEKEIERRSFSIHNMYDQWVPVVVRRPVVQVSVKVNVDG